MSGWDNSDRRSRLPADWKTRVQNTKKRAGGQCEWKLPSGKRCPRAGSECDHRRNNDDHSPSNLQWLCVDHHKKKTAGESLVGRVKKRRPTKRPEERHPGLRPS